MIRSFRSRETQRLAEDQDVPRFRAIQRMARRKLALLTAARQLDDLRSPPGNRLEALRGDRAGQHSIGVNDRWRLCFEWREGEACAVELCDYHD
jgi:proteic killer suppression protein